MHILKKILIVVVIIIAIPLIVALFVKKDYAVVKEITVNKPKLEVFDYIKHLKNQGNFSVWQMADPEMIKTYTGTDGTVGFVASWDSQKEDVGKGSQKITKIAEGERLETLITFIRPFEAEDNAYMTTESIDSTHTKVTWGFSGAFSYPLNLMQLFMDMDKQVGGDLQKGLENLKILMEKK